MVAPIISFYTSSGNATDSSVVWITSSWGAMSAVFDFGTIDTGSSGSTIYFWVVNNYSGSANVSDALLSSSGQAQGDGVCLGFGHHASGSADHAAETTANRDWDLQSGSLTGSVWASSSWYFMTDIGISGSRGASGSLSMPYINIVSGSAATGRRLFTPGAFYILSGSQTGGRSGSAWLIASYLSILSTTPQGPKTGSFCLRYKYT
jgi:hypothetical protein